MPRAETKYCPTRWDAAMNSSATMAEEDAAADAKKPRY
jgi:hypothetical protein